MAQENINYGSFPNDPLANTIRDAFIATQNNFDTLFSGAAANANVSQIIAGDGISLSPANGVGNVTVTNSFNSLRVRSNTISVSSIGGTLDGSTVVIPNSSTTLILELNSNTNANSSLFNLSLSGNLTVSGSSVSVPNATVTLGTGNLVLTSGRLVGNVQGSGGNGAIQYTGSTGTVTGTSVFNFDTALNRLTVPAITTTQITSANANVVEGVFSNLAIGNASSNNLTIANVLTANTANFSGNVVGTRFSGNLTGNILDPALANTVIFYSSSGISTGSSNFTYNGSNLELTNGRIISANITGNLTGTASFANVVVNGVQSNITAVGNLSSLNVLGNTVVGSLTSLGNLTGDYGTFGNLLVNSNISLTNLSGSRANIQINLTAQEIVSNTSVTSASISSNTSVANTSMQTPIMYFVARTSDPVSPVGGMVYYNSIMGKLRVYNNINSTWDDLN
jgi:hypothetical protein